MQLTPNRRCAAFLQNKGHTDVLPLNSWLEQLYSQLFQEILGLPYCLSAHEEEIIWESIIRQSEPEQWLLKPTHIARLAKEAWYLSSQWRLPDHDINQAMSEDNRAYQIWVKHYQSECRLKNWVDCANIVPYLIDAIHKQQLVLPKEVTLIGFEEFTPQLKLFLNDIQKVGCTVQFRSLVLEKNGRVNRLIAKDQEEELRLAAAMANQWMKKTPNCVIGIVVPALEKQRTLVMRVFEEICLVPFNISAPLSLDRYPLIEAALLALSLLTDEIPLEKFSRVLRSPFFGYSVSQMITRAAMDIAVRSFKERECSVEKLINIIKRMMNNPDMIPDLQWIKALKCFFEQYATLQGKRSAMHWKKDIEYLLNLLGWPGERPLTSEEYQLQQQWEKLLEIYVAMGSLLNDHNYHEAIFQLGRLAKATSFLPASPNASIQVLGILEAAGLPFDYLWVTGLHRDAWPLEPAPNPFIPLAIQRAHDLPRSSAARELKVAKRFTEVFCKSAKQIVFSYPAVIEERMSTVSPLIAHWPEIFKESLGLTDCPSSIQIALSKSTVVSPFLAYLSKKNYKECVHYLAGSPLAVETSETLLGGTNFLKLQALCPFRAFAEIRLRACPLPKTKIGLDEKDRGEIVHQALYFLWGEIPNQTVLQALSAKALNHSIEKAFEKAVAQWQARYFIHLAPRYLALEKKRTCDLLYQLCELEKMRPYFEVVGREEERSINLQGLQLTIRIDRVDRTQEQEEILIDYKTGQVSISDWFQDRPRDPQLPLYCITRERRPIGVIFSIIRPDGVKFQGLTKEERCLPGVKAVTQLRSRGSAATFEEQCTSWQNALGSLARDFKAGVATVDPVDGESTCKSCSLKSLCRIKAQIEQAVD